MAAGRGLVQKRKVGSVELAPGKFAKLSNLVKRPELNGQVCLVLAVPTSPGERMQVELCSSGKLLQVRPANLESSVDAFWRFPGVVKGCKDVYSRLSLLELVRDDPRLATLDVCDEFAKCLWERLAPVPPPVPLSSDIIEMILQQSGHKFYWLALDAIAHHLMLESCNGR